MFTDKQIAELSKKLDASNIKTRQQAGMTLSYIEGHHARREASRIFGFGSWEQEIMSISHVGSGETRTGKPKVSYLARVKITVYDKDGMRHVSREDVGYGSGIDQDEPSAHENAAKEAVTDAMKRALMSFGDQFGLALYDKAQEHVETAREAYMRGATEHIKSLKTRDEATSWWGDESQKRRNAGLSKYDVSRLSSLIKDQIDNAKT